MKNRFVLLNSALLLAPLFCAASTFARHDHPGHTCVCVQSWRGGAVKHESAKRDSGRRMGARGIYRSVEECGHGTPR